MTKIKSNDSNINRSIKKINKIDTNFYSDIGLTSYNVVNGFHTTYEKFEAILKHSVCIERYIEKVMKRKYRIEEPILVRQKTL